jgi:hypothetical protein
MTKLVFDYDGVIFKAACVAQSTSVKVTSEKYNIEKIFKNRTEVYGHYKKKAGGWLAEQDFGLDDIQIEDIIEVQPVENALQVAKTIINGVLQQFDTDDYYGHVSGVGNFRKNICTLLEYKGNRKDLVPPVHLQAVKQYLIDHHRATSSINREPDDCLCSDMYLALKRKEELIGVVFEKDYMGTDGNWYNYNDSVLHTVRGFGELHRTDKGIKGTGRLWKYFQVSHLDSADNYSANCFSDVKNGEVKVFNVFKDCKTDKEAFEAMVKHFKELYPEPKVVQGCKGEITIDWLYVMQECFNMAHLERWEGDRINVKEVMQKLGVEL